MSNEGFQLSIAQNGKAWTSYVRIHQQDGCILEAKDDCETLDYAVGMAIVQLQAWIEHKKGLPPAGVKFGSNI